MKKNKTIELQSVFSRKQKENLGQNNNDKFLESGFVRSKSNNKEIIKNNCLYKEEEGFIFDFFFWGLDYGYFF